MNITRVNTIIVDSLGLYFLIGVLFWLATIGGYDYDDVKWKTGFTRITIEILLFIYCLSTWPQCVFYGVKGFLRKRKNGFD